MRLEFNPLALEDWQYWERHNKKTAIKIVRLIDATLNAPFKGIGKPEPLKYELSGCWSRRIDKTNRLVYRVEEGVLVILSCRYHY